MSVLINAVVNEQLHFGQLPISEVKGFVDEMTGELFTSGFLTAPLDPYAMEKEWERIDSIDQLAIKPAIVWRVKCSPARIENEASS